jgi:hypothetical protein
MGEVVRTAELIAQVEGGKAVRRCRSTESGPVSIN